MFNNGLQVVGDYTKTDGVEKSILMTKPVQLVQVPDASGVPGRVSMGFSPFLQYLTEWETGITFMVADILTVGTPLSELVNNYNTSFGSGLVLPPGVAGR